MKKTINNPMFRETEPGIAVSTEGFTVIARGTKTQYIENDHEAVFPCSLGKKWIVHLKEVCWSPPYSNEPISLERQAEIQRRVMDAQRFLKSFVEFDV